MKTFLVAVITAVVSAILTLIVTKAFFTDKPELFYTITTPINSNFSDSARQEYLQFLTIKNNGNLQAERIIISIHSYTGIFQIKKYSSEDEVTSKTNGNNFELIYPRLPPDGQFEVLFKTNSTVNEQSLVLLCQVTIFS